MTDVQEANTVIQVLALDCEIALTSWEVSTVTFLPLFIFKASGVS